MRKLIGTLDVSRRRIRRPWASRTITAGLTIALTTGVVADASNATSTGDKALLAKAKKSLLVRSDMPKGWTSSKASGGDNSKFPGATQLANCIGVPVSVINYNAPSSNSPDFASKNHLLTVNDSVSVFSSVKRARVDFASGTNAKAPSCLAADLNGAGRAAFVSEFGANATVGNMTVSRLPAADFAPGAANLTIFFPVTTQGTTLNVQISEVVILHGREEQNVTFTSIQSNFPIPLERHLTALAARRL